MGWEKDREEDRLGVALVICPGTAVLTGRDPEIV